MLDVYKYIYFFIYIFAVIYIYIYIFKKYISIYTHVIHPICTCRWFSSFFTALPKFFNGRIAFSMSFNHVSCSQGWSLEILFIVNDGRLWKPSLPPGGNRQRWQRSPFWEGSVVFGAILFGKKSTKQAAHVSGQIITTNPPVGHLKWW